MGLYERKGSKFWHVWIDGASRPRVNTKIPIDGTAKQRKANRRLAEQVYHRLMLDQAGHRFGLPSAKPDRTFAEQRAWYETHVTAQKRSAISERSHLGQLGAFFDGYQLRAITQPLVREWRTSRVGKVKASTIQRHEALLRHLLGTAIPEYLDAHPLHGLPGVRVTPTDTRILTRDEETRLLAALQTPTDKALILCALDTLLRLSNVTQLTRAQDHGRFLYSDTKAGAVRVPISSRLRTALDAVPGKGRYYFPAYVSDRNSDLTRRMFVTACTAAGLTVGRNTGGLSFHCLRHTGATRMLAAGVDVKTVMRIGGWKTLTVLNRYLHPTDEAAREAVEAIGGK